MKTKYLIGLIITLGLTSISCSDRAELSYLKPTIVDKDVTDKFGEDTSVVFDPKADILFVVDNSGSMNTHQMNLANNINLFTNSFFKASILDYNISVVTTDMDGYSSPCCGEFWGFPLIVNQGTPDPNLALQRNLRVGTSGAGREAPFDAVGAALSPDLLNGYNKGFLRPRAALIVIFITDAEDQSRTYSPQSLVASLLALKNNEKRLLLSYGAIVPTNDTTRCARDDNATPRRIEAFLDLVPNGKAAGGPGGNSISLCATNYGQKFADWSLEIVKQVTSTIVLSRRPDQRTLRVTYGSIDLPMDVKKGWIFNAEKNAIELGPEIDWLAQPSGSKVEVHYKEARG